MGLSYLDLRGVANTSQVPPSRHVPFPVLDDDALQVSLILDSYSERDNFLMARDIVYSWSQRNNRYTVPEISTGLLKNTEVNRDSCRICLEFP